MQSYQTQNFALALTLATCGVPFFTEGDTNPILNVYSAEILRTKYGNRYKGMTLERAAEAAWAEGNQGQVTYCFQRTDTLERILNAYGSQSALLIADYESGAPTINAGEFTEMEPEDAARICCQLLANRKKLINAWKGCTPIIAVPGGSKTERHGERSVTVGSMKLMSINPSAETRAKLRL